MSFWNRLGDIAKASPLGAIGAFNIAQSTLFHDDGESIGQAFKGAAIDAAKPMQNLQETSLAKAVQAPIIWTGDQASHAISTAWNVGDISEAHGGSQWRPFYSASDWSNAWNETDGITGGESIANSVRQHGLGTLVGLEAKHVEGGMFAQSAPSQASRDSFEEWRKTTAGAVSSGALDLITTWYADPTIAIGAGAKLARTANHIEDAVQAEQVARAFDAKGLAAAPARLPATARGKALSTSSNETATRLSHQIAKTDNMDVNEVAAHLKPLLARTSTPAPIVDLFGQAGKITDMALQRQVKADVLLTAAGSATARARLIESAPAIARAMETSSKALPEFARLDTLAESADRLYARGDSLTAAARAIGEDTGNKATIEAYGQTLDRIHRHMRDLDTEAQAGGLERVGMTALDRAKVAVRSRTAQEFYYQDGSSGLTTRVLHWGVNQRSRGVVATNDAFRGHEELMDQLTRSGLYSGAERAHVSEKWWGANGQSLRNKVVDDLWEDMIARAAAKKGYTPEDVKVLTEGVVAARFAGRKYTTAQLEAARAEGASRVTLTDPHTGTPTQIDRALFEGHLRDNVALPDTDLIERTLAHDAGTRGLPQTLRNGGEKFMEAANPLSDWWRLAVLARPGLFVRTQLDTQGRSLAMMGATSVLAQAMKGAGHKIGATLNRDQMVEVGARAQDLLERDHAVARAAELRRQATLESGPKGQRLLDRAKQIEDEANKRTTYLASGQYAGATDKTMKVAGQNVTTRAYTSDDDMRSVWDALLPGDATMSDLLTNLEGHAKAKFIEDSHDWQTYAPEDLKWSNGWTRASDAIRTSYTGRRILRDADHPTVDLVSSLRKDARVRAEWLNVKFDNPSFDEWIDRTVSHVADMAPTAEIRKTLLSRRPTEGDIGRLFVNRGEVSTEAFAAKRQAAGEKVLKLKRDLADHVSMRATNDPGALRTRTVRQTKLEDRLATARAELSALEEGKPLANTGGKADRMHVIGPAFSPLHAKGEKASLANAARKFISVMSDQPDTILARHPLYVNRYYKHFETLAKREITREGVLDTAAQARIEKMARHRAIKDVQQTMYDTARYTGAHSGVMRLASPFLNAWEDAMTSWSRLMYDDPKVLGGLIKTWNAPERAGLIIDQDGNRVRPGQDAQQKFVTLPLGVAGKFIGVKELQLRKDSWNSIFQGEVWWQPGYGPLATVPAQQIVTRAFPELVDPNGPTPAVLRPFLRALVNGDAPKVRPGPTGLAKDVAQGVLPSWLQKGVSAFDPTSPAYTNVFQDSVNSQVIAMRQAGKEPSRADWDRIQKRAAKAARNTAIVKAVALGGFGQSSEGNGIAKFYSDQYNALQQQADQIHSEGKTVEQVFSEQFPEAAGLNWSISMSETGISATLNTEDRAKKFASDIAKTPEYGRFYEGSDNVGGEFSSSIYNAQSSRRTSPGSSRTQRRRLEPDEMVNRTQTSLGWGEYQRVNTKIDLILEARGLHSINQKGADDLRMIKKQFVAQLSNDNPAWGKDYDNFDAGVLDRFITQFAEPATSDPRMRGRSDIKLMSQYLDARKKAMALAEANGYTLTSDKGAPLRAVLDQVGAEMARQDLGFEQQWTSMWSREVEDSGN